MEEPSVSDILADARRDWRHWHNFAIGSAAIVWGIAFFRLRDPELADSAREFWTKLPWPFLAVALWATFSRERRLGELERSIERDADAIAMKVTTFLILGIVLLDVAGHEIGWEFMIWPLLIRSLAWTWARRRLKLP